MTLGVNCGLFVAGVLVLNLTEGLALVVPALLASALGVSLLAGIVLLLRPRTRVVGHGVVVATLWALLGQVLVGAFLLVAWLSFNSN